MPLWSFSGTTGALWSQSDFLQPYVGYYFDNVTNLAKLKIPYKSALGKPTAAPAKLWQLTVSIESTGLKESSSQLGVAKDALAGWDQYDYRKPHAISADFPGAYFSRPQWDETYGIFATDFRPPFESMEIWPLTVTAAAGQKVVLTVEGLEGVQPAMEVYLLDKEHLSYVDLGQQDSYSFTAVRPENEFEILVGDKAAIEQELQKIIPQDFALGRNYPNPFNPVTTIPVLLPENSDIRIVVYNSLGQKVKTLFSGHLSAGRHYFSLGRARSIREGHSLGNLSVSIGHKRW